MKKDKKVLNLFFFNKNNTNNRIFKILVINMIVGIIFINVANISLKGSEQNNSIENKTIEVAKIEEPNDVNLLPLESRLENILSQIDGTGVVNVMITYSESKELIHASNDVQKSEYVSEKDSEGGIRESNSIEKSSEIIFFENGGGNQNPVIEKSIEPKVLGVLVVAEGAGNIVVRDRIVDAVSALLDVPSHRVQVLKRKK